MLIVGCENRRMSESCQLRSCTQCSTPNSALIVASGTELAYATIIFFCASDRGLTFSKKPSTAGVWPSFCTKVLSACTRCQDGESTCASRLEWMSFFGPRPQVAPSDTSSSSTTPLAPAATCTLPSVSCEASGKSTPTQPFMCGKTSGLLTISPKCGEAISSSPSQTSTRLTGSFLPVALNAASALKK